MAITRSVPPPENTERDKMNEMPKRLPTTKYKEKEYFIDERLREFRPVHPPLEFIPFDSELGIKIKSELQKRSRPFLL